MSTDRSGEFLGCVLVACTRSSDFGHASAYPAAPPGGFRAPPAVNKKKLIAGKRAGSRDPQGPLPSTAQSGALPRGIAGRTVAGAAFPEKDRHGLARTHARRRPAVLPVQPRCLRRRVSMRFTIARSPTYRPFVRAAAPRPRGIPLAF